LIKDIKDTNFSSHFKSLGENNFSFPTNLGFEYFIFLFLQVLSLAVVIKV